MFKFKCFRSLNVLRDLKLNHHIAEVVEKARKRLFFSLLVKALRSRL